MVKKNLSNHDELEQKANNNLVKVVQKKEKILNKNIKYKKFTM